MRRQDNQAGITHVHQGGHHELAGIRLHLIAEGEGGFIPVVAIGDIEFRISQNLLGGLDCGRISNFPDPVDHLVIIHSLESGWARRSGEDGACWLWIEHENMALLGAARAEQSNPVSLGF